MGDSSWQEARDGGVRVRFRIRPGTPDDAPGVGALINAVIAEGAPVLLTGAFTDEQERAFLERLAPRGGLHVAEVWSADRVVREGDEPAAGEAAGGASAAGEGAGGAARDEDAFAAGDVDALAASDDDETRAGDDARAAGDDARAAGAIVAAQVFAPYAAAMPAHDHVAVMGTWVRPEWRRRGLGRALSERSFAAARASGFTRVFTDLRADNLDSLAFHLALGFGVAGYARGHAVIGGRAHDVLFIEREL